MSRLDIVCDDVFAAELPLGRARLVYADPPYTLEDVHGYGTWPDEEELVRRMQALGADDCAYVLHCGWDCLESLLPVITELAPKRTVSYAGQHPYRILPWVKPWRRASRNISQAFLRMSEPVVVWYGRRYRNPARLNAPDWICAVRSQQSLNGHATQKPEELLEWLFDRLLAGEVAGRLAVDLYAGTGGAAIAAARRGMHAIAVERDADHAARIAENAALPVRRPGWAPVVEVSPNGLPRWETLGRLDEALLARAQGHDAPVGAEEPGVESGALEAPAACVEEQAGHDRSHPLVALDLHERILAAGQEGA